MLRVGMTNPPFILDQLEDIAEILNHPNVFSFLHVPVQSGSNSVLHEMNREYTVRLAFYFDQELLPCSWHHMSPNVAILLLLPSLLSSLAQYEEFCQVVDVLKAKVPEITIATV